MKTRIGIHVHAEPDRFRDSLAAVQEHTSGNFELVILPDGPDAPTRTFLSGLDEFEQLATQEPRGAPASFNRLISSGTADLWVVLESGALVGPEWLDRLVAALDSGPTHGIAGPSTNRAWNEQGAFPEAGGTPDDIARTAAEAAHRFGNSWRTLQPLHSLADFCYAVRREVIDAIGGADEAYGCGPCWEMDYNIRAARAGFIGVWACSAYVYRAPFTARRARDELALMETNKRLYQSSFCARHHGGLPQPFRSHCRGDACPNFAQPRLISIQRPSQPMPAPYRYGAMRSDTSLPLVSCIMPTADRRAFVPEAIRCFQNQDYPRLELLVVDDGVDPVQDCLPDDPRIRYLRLDSKPILGKKRNLACAQARGEIIVHWDDDDWYPPWRARTQVAALIQQNASVCGTSRLYYRDQATHQAWEYKCSGRRWVAGNTLAYRREFWARHPFPEIQIGEDARFISRAETAAIVDLQDPMLCVATVHSNNTSRKMTKGSLWTQCEIGALQERMAREEATLVETCAIDRLPLVSCIMPTYNRRAFIALSMENYLRQSYPNRELVIVDDGSDPVEDIVAGYPGVRYVHLAQRTSIGAKRNLACAEARGALIAHWDDDDWYSPDRLERQVLPIIQGKYDLTGLENQYVLVLPSGDMWTQDRELHRRMFVGDVHGGTLVFQKSIWAAGLRYPEVNLAEDAAFLAAAVRKDARLLRVQNEGCFVYVRHSANAWKFEPGQFLSPQGWRRTTAPDGFDANTQEQYRAAALLYLGASSMAHSASG